MFGIQPSCQIRSNFNRGEIVKLVKFVFGVLRLLLLLMLHTSTIKITTAVTTRVTANFFLYQMLYIHDLISTSQQLYETGIVIISIYRGKNGNLEK